MEIRDLVRSIAKTHIGRVIAKMIKRDYGIKISDAPIQEDDYQRIENGIVPVFEICELCQHKEGCGIRKAIIDAQLNGMQQLYNQGYRTRYTFAVHDCESFKMVKQHGN